MDVKDYEQQLGKIRENIRRIKENDVESSFDEELEDGDLVDETTRRLLGLNKLKRDTTELIEGLKGKDLSSKQLKKLEALETDFSDVLTNVHASANVPTESKRNSPSDETNPFLPQYSAIRENVEREEMKEYAQGQHSVRKNSQPANIAELCRLTTLVSSNTQKIKTTVNDISRMIEHIGTSNDSHEFKERMSEKLQYSQKLVKDTMSILEDVNVTLPEQKTSEQKSHKKQVQKLAKELDIVAKQFQSVQKDLASKQKAFLDMPSESYDEQVSTNVTGLQQQALLPTEIDDIREQNETLQQLESDIVDVNEIFNQLHVMVNDQGEKIGRIEDHVNNGAEYVEKAHTNLVKTEKSQVGRRKKIIICATVGIIFLITLIVIVVISVS